MRVTAPINVTMKMVMQRMRKMANAGVPTGWSAWPGRWCVAAEATWPAKLMGASVSWLAKRGKVVIACY